MKVRQKSLWRSQNNMFAHKRRNQRAAKERKRMERAMREEVMPDCSHVVAPGRAKPLFVVTIRCRDGESVQIAIHEMPWGFSPSRTEALAKIGAVLKHYRPVPPARGGFRS